MGASLGPILCSAPTHVAVDNFASRLHARIQAISERYNTGKATDDPSRLRHSFVLRVFTPDNEVDAVRTILEHPDSVGEPKDKGKFSSPSRWKLPLSLAYWFLVLLRSPAVEPLHPDASPALCKLQELYDADMSLSVLRDVSLYHYTIWDCANEYSLRLERLLGPSTRLVSLSRSARSRT